MNEKEKLLVTIGFTPPFPNRAYYSLPIWIPVLISENEIDRQTSLDQVKDLVLHRLENAIVTLTNRFPEWKEKVSKGERLIPQPVTIEDVRNV